MSREDKKRANKGKSVCGEIVSGAAAQSREKMLFQRLAKSKFRSGFKLATSDLEYVKTRGMELVRQHAEALLRKRIIPAHPKNDGKQTPYKGHPVFVAQHGTAFCCRKCIAKWHKIPEGRPMTEAELSYAVNIIMRFIEKEVYSKIGCELVQPFRKKK